jgi:hypothetical protein
MPKSHSDETTSNSRRRFLACGALALTAAALARGQSAPAPAPASPEVKQALKAEQAREVKNRARQLVRTIQPLVKKFGPEVLTVLQAATAEDAQARFEKMNLPKRDLTTVKELLWDKLNDPEQYQFTVLDRTEETFRCKVTKCHLAEAFRAAGGGEIGYALNCAWDSGFCRGLNPQIKFTRTKTLMQGDDHCNHSYELQKA